jgi:hypothetical protein
LLKKECTRMLLIGDNGCKKLLELSRKFVLEVEDRAIWDHGRL